jgi:enhancing lycopene biosynthesis protein 2
MKQMPRFAVILSGCGRADGSEIHEATLALLAIDNNGASYSCFAPDILQSTTINHLTSSPVSETRNVLEESARIARGNISPLTQLNLEEFDCILFPGGLGAITNWCDFNQKSFSCSVNEEIKNILEQAYTSHKVIGAMCIAPVLLARVLGKYGITITIGNDKNLAAKIEKTKAHHQDTTKDDICEDKENLIVTTPAYMLATSIKDVAIGADKMVKSMIELATKYK